MSNLYNVRNPTLLELGRACAKIERLTAAGLKSFHLPGYACSEPSNLMSLNTKPDVRQLGVVR